MLLDETYQHTQSTPATEWIVQHDLDRYVVQDTFFDIGGNLSKVLPASVEYIDSNSIKIVFSEAQTGTVKVS